MFDTQRPSSPWRWLVLIAMLMVSVLSGRWLAATAHSDALFVEVAAPLSARSADVSEALRTRYVRINPALLTSKARSPLVIELFDDKWVTAEPLRLDTLAQNEYVWVGREASNPLSDISLAVTDGVMVGSFNLVQEMYQVSYVGDGVHAIRQMPLDFRSDLPPVVPAADSVLPVDPPLGDIQAPSAAIDSGVINVMVLYTPRARAAVGSTLAMQSLINLAFSESNTGLANSGIKARFAKAYAAEIAYSEVGNFFTDLERVSFVDGYIDNVHNLRNFYQADVVSLIIDGDTYCGLAWLMPELDPKYEARAFSVVDWRCATGFYSFAHEIGHNMGSDHNRSGSTATPIYPYSYGFQNPDGGFRTIMAYNCAGTSCPRVNRWSHSNLLLNGYATGVPCASANAADNSYSINQAASLVANFRVSAQAAPPNLDESVFLPHIQTQPPSYTCP